MRPGVTECIHKNWNELTQTYMADGLRHPITPVFIDKLNRAIRKVTSEMIGDHAVLSRADVEGGRGLGYRQQHDELSFNYLPQKAILREVNRYCDWVNEEIVACDRGEKNPILVATAACQRLVSIHPFSNGNGRTARFIADLILRRYGILPSGWKTEKIPVFLHEVVDEDTGDRIPPVTPTIAAERMLEGLANSYALVGTKKEGG
jgi:Fic family protein